MRIAHVDRYKRHRTVVDHQLIKQHLGFAHMHLSAVHLSVRSVQTEGTYAAEGLNTHLRLAAKTALVEVFPNATNSVSAHLCFRAIGIEDAHPSVRLIRRDDQH